MKIIANGCSDSVQIPETVKPAVLIQAETLEGCTPLKVQFNYTATENIDEFLWSFGSEGNSTTVDPLYTFVNPDTTDRDFDVSLRILSAEGCESSDFNENMIRVHPLPTVDIGFDESVCYNENEEIWYRGTAGSGDTFISNLSDLQPENIIENPGNTAGLLIFELPGKPTAEIGLQVISEFGCKTDTFMKTYKRNPVFTISPDTVGGCPPFDVNLSVSTADSSDQVDY